MPIAALAAPAITAGLADIGVTGALGSIGGALGGAGLAAGAGAGLGAGLGALTGQGAGAGAASGAAAGGIGGLAGEAGGALGNLVGFPGIGQAAGGAIGGALGSTITGGSPITGALEGVALGGPTSMVGASGGFGGGIGTAVPAEATAGAVQPLGTPVLSSAAPMTGDAGLSDRLLNAPFTDTGGGGTTGGVNPTDVTGMDVGPPPNTTVDMNVATFQPYASGTGALQTAAAPTDPATGAPTSLVGPQGGTMTPPYPSTADPAVTPTGGTETPWWGGQPWTNVQNAPNTGDANTTWFNQPVNPGEAAYNAAPGASKGPLGSIADMIKNPASLLTAGLGGYQLLTAKRDMAKELLPLQQAQTGAAGMATALTAPSMSGVLPVGQQSALENERRKQYAAVEGQAAKTGMAGTTMERDAKMQVDADIASQQVGIQNELLGRAAQYAQLAGTDATQLIADQMKQDENYSNALARFVAALAGGVTGGTTRTTATA